LKESSDGETLIAVGIILWFQICGATEEKARRSKSVLVLGSRNMQDRMARGTK